MLICVELRIQNTVYDCCIRYIADSLKLKTLNFALINAEIKLKDNIKTLLFMHV